MPFRILNLPMTQFDTFQLDNGLEVYVITDNSTPLAVFNLLYKVGSRDEDPEKTGFAHLFEHLMFGGSKNVRNFDEPLQKVGGENNAFTTTDLTNYYISMPAANLETAFWLESDRMLSLSFDQKVLDIQKSVVMEEFKQRYLNQPYGDVWLKLRSAAYQSHSYQWPTIGKSLDHIEKATMEDVKDFFYRYYVPNNATLVVAGNVTVEKVKRLSQKWFGPIAPGEIFKREIPLEAPQREARSLEIENDVPLDALYSVYHIPSRRDSSYVTYDLASDILGRGKSSFMYQNLVKKNTLFSSINCFCMGCIDPGLLTISGKLEEGVSFSEAEEGVKYALDKLKQGDWEEEALTKVKNQAETSYHFGQIELLNRAFTLAMSVFYGDPYFTDREMERTIQTQKKDVIDFAAKDLILEKSTTLYYKSIDNGKA